jgi:DNA repair protein SbcC/Rad50
MRLDGLEIKGVLRFADRFRLDLRELPDGLIAIVGGNGEGKTTLLETPMAALFREFPSRSDSSLYDCAQGRDAYLQSEFTIENRAYTARVNIDAVGRHTDAVITSPLSDGTPFPLTEGKGSKSFDQWVRDHLPPQDVVLAGAFAAQFRKRGNITQLDKKDRKELFVQALGLKHLERMALTAGEAADLVSQALDRLTARREALARDCGPEREAALANQLRGLQEQQAGLEEARERLAIRIDLATTTHNAAVDAAQRAAVLNEQYRAAQASVQEADREIMRIESDQDRLEQRRAADLQNLEERTADKVKDLTQRIERNKGLQGRADAIRASAREVLAIEQRLATLALDEEAARAQLTDLEARARGLDAEIAAMRQQREALARARTDSQTITAVPFGDRCAAAACQFLTRAIAAKATIPGLEAAIEPLGLRESSRAELDRMLSQTRELLDGLKTAIRDSGRSLAQERERAKDLPHLEASEARIAELQNNLAAVQADATAQRERLHQQAQEQLETLQLRLTSVQTQRAARYQEYQRLGTERVPLTDAEEARIEAAAELRRAQQDQQDVATKLATCLAQTDAVVDAQGRLADTRAAVADVDGRIADLQTELVDYQILARTLGRDGLQTLEIDAAGPGISTMTNELLQATSFGARFTVDLITQVPTKDGKGFKEVFEIQVTDARSGGAPRDVSLLSGGEQAVVVDCLMSAIACYVNVRSPMPIRTLWRDEPTSAMDAENRAAYIPMLRKIREVGQFEKVLFITHDEDQARAADVQIYVHDGTAEILYPPYAERQAA